MMSKVFKGHPKGLETAVLTGMWENFALFGMRTILVFYLVKDLGFAERDAIQTYAMSTSAGFLLTLAGAFVADRIVGLRWGVAIGASGMAVGHLMLIAPGLLYPGLILITLAYGLFKPTLISQVSQLYALDDPRRDQAFTLYKAGANAGAIAAPIACGAVGASLGFGMALGLCGLGMIVSLVTYLFGLKHMQAHPDALAHKPAEASGGQAGRGSALGQLALVLLGAVLFWAAYNQIGGSVALWLDEKVDRVVHLGRASFEVPAAWAQSLNPILIVALTPLVNRLWSRHPGAAGARELGRMAAGAAMLAIAFAILWLGVEASGAALAHPAWLLATIALLSLAEIYFDPIGQAYVLRFARAGLISITASIWLVAQAAGVFAAGLLAAFWGRWTPGQYFLGVAIVAAAAVTILLLARLLSRAKAGPDVLESEPGGARS